MKLKTRLKRLASALLVLAILVVLVVVGRGLLVSSKQLVPQPPKSFELREGYAQRLATSITFETISDVDPQQMDMQAWEKLGAFMENSFPRVHQELKKEVIGPCSWVYEWSGSGQGAPILLLAHADVVPVEASKAQEWTHPPFAGHLDDTFVWGRGALDDKVSVFAILEAVEGLLAQGKRPNRSIFLGFGCDEEVGGALGAKQMVEHFRARNLEFEWTLDEGHIIGQGFFPGIEKPIAFIGMAEKGYLTLNLSAEGEGGHSSMPPNQTAVGVLSAAIARLEAAPFPTRLTPPVRGMLENLGPEVSGPLKFVFANLWLLEPVILRVLSGKVSTNATVRTTTAATVFQGGVRENVLPKTASAQVNFRILPGETRESVLARVTDVVDDDRVRIDVPTRGFASDPTSPSAPDSPGYTGISQAVRNVFGEDVLVAPSLTIAGTDTRHFEGIAKDTFRFLPITLTQTDTPRIHGVDERVSRDAYAQAIRFYAELLGQNMVQ